MVGVPHGTQPRHRLTILNTGDHRGPCEKVNLIERCLCFFENLLFFDMDSRYLTRDVGQSALREKRLATVPKVVVFENCNGGILIVVFLLDVDFWVSFQLVMSLSIF